jgi:cellulose synthase/poly-beta-1,6-N-acetylglucosamine synthase-like glycosyltransferase
MISKVRKDKVDLGDKDYQPNATILIAAYNEEEYIAKCLDSIIESDYPIEKLNIVVGSDGSTDQTNSIVETYEKSHPSIRLIMLERGGKNNVLNIISGLADTEIVYFMDADTRLDKNSLNGSIKFFNDTTVGGVIVNMVSLNQQGEVDEGNYQKFEAKLRKLESGIKTTVNSLGAFYAIRKENIENNMNPLVCDDYITIMKTISRGGKVKFYGDSPVNEYRPKDEIDETQRRIRLTAGGLHTIFSYPKNLNPFALHGFFLISHKLIRYLMPYAYLASVIASMLLYTFIGGIWSLVFLFTILPLILFVLHLISKKNTIKLKPVQYSVFLISMLYGIHLGWIAFLKGRNNSIWTH